MTVQVERGAAMPHTELTLREVRSVDYAGIQSAASEAIIALQVRAEAGLVGALQPDVVEPPFESYLDRLDKMDAEQKLPNTLGMETGPRDFEG
jgi:hypothetical protein